MPIAKLSDFLEKFDEWLIIPLMIPFLKMVFEKFGEKGAEKTAEKVSEMLGFDLNKASKDVIDEIIFSAALYLCEIHNDQKTEVREFESRLRKENPQQAQAFVLFVAKAIKKFEVEEKETSGGKKGSKKTESTRKNIDGGVLWAKHFFLDLLRNNSHEEKVSFLEGIDVFSLITSEETTTSGWQKTKTVFNLTDQKANELAEKLEGFTEEITIPEDPGFIKGVFGFNLSDIRIPKFSLPKWRRGS